MPESAHPNPELAPPHVQLIEMGNAALVPMIVHAAAKFGLADHLANGPKGAEVLAGLTGTHAPSLYRLMRTLAGLGIVIEDSRHQFALTSLGEALKTGAPGAARSTILSFAADHMWRAMEMFPYSVETGKPSFDKVWGMPQFSWFAQHPAEASLFSEAMMGLFGREPSAVAAAYDFSGLNILVDVGGATGNMLTTILHRHVGLRGILFDLPHVEKDATALIQSRGLADRISITTGSFFESVPTGGDAYLLSHIIHDWSETQALAILRHCREAVGIGGRLLLIEMVLPEDNTMHPAKIMDMVMLMALGGQERTQQEYRTLLDRAGFRLTRVVPTSSPSSVVEAIPA
jgi:O-methyltransferase domain